MSTLIRYPKTTRRSEDLPIVFITSCKTGRYLFEAGPDGDVSSKRGAEGGWTHENNKPVLTADADHYNRARWKIVPMEVRHDLFFIESCKTGRYLFEAGPDDAVGHKRGAEGGDWSHDSKFSNQAVTKTTAWMPALTADANYGNRAAWKIVPVPRQPGKVFIESCHTGRYLFEAAGEGGWTHENNTPVLTVDGNYHDRALWEISGWPRSTLATGLGNVPVATVPNVIRKALPNVRSSKASDIEQLWGAVDTSGVAMCVRIAFLELTWSDQGYGARKGHLHARKDGGAWRKMSTDAAEHELTRESFEIPAELLGGKLELGFSVGSQGGHRLTITNAEVEITERKDLITVGNHSGRCPKVVTLPFAGLQVGNTPVNPQGADWNDRFRVEVEGNVLKVFRVDAPNCGWGQQLVLGAL